MLPLTNTTVTFFSSFFCPPASLAGVAGQPGSGTKEVQTFHVMMQRRRGLMGLKMQADWLADKELRCQGVEALLACHPLQRVTDVSEREQERKGRERERGRGESFSVQGEKLPRSNFSKRQLCAKSGRVHSSVGTLLRIPGPVCK